MSVTFVERIIILLVYCKYGTINIINVQLKENKV